MRMQAAKPERLPERIVSLVPSLTEALFSLGLGDRLVGVTDWCVHPRAGVAALPKVGGTKNPDLDAIRALSPDLVIANQEENTRSDVAKLLAANVPVWVTYPRTVDQGVALLRELAELGGAHAALAEVVVPVESRVARARVERPLRPTRVFCPIWKAPWMAVGADTFIHDLLVLCGGENVFAQREGRRYPIVSEAEIVAAAPECVLLPDEPYAFGPLDAREIAGWEIPAAQSGRIHLIDGSLVSWYGPRIGPAVDALHSLLVSKPAPR